MLSTAADVASLAQAAPWLAVGLLSLVASAWVYRQGRRSVREVEERSSLSAVRQGKRLGELTQQVGLLDLRRRQVEWVLLDEGLDLPYWPADGPQQPRPRQRPADVDEDQADDEPLFTAEAPRIPVPPLDPEISARHRRTRTA